MATPFEGIGGLLGMDPEQLKQLLAQFAPSDDDRKSAKMQALAQFGLGLLGTRKGYEWDQVGAAGQNALAAQQSTLQGAQQGKADQFKMAEYFAKMKAGQEEAKRKQGYLAQLVGPSPVGQSAAGQSAPQSSTRDYLLSIGVPEQAIAAVAMSADPAAEVGKLIKDYTTPFFGAGKTPMVRAPGGGFKVSVPQGMNEALVAQSGAETAAVEDAKAARDLVQVDRPDGTKQWMTRAQAAAMFGGPVGRSYEGGGLGTTQNPEAIKAADAARAVQTEQEKKIAGTQADEFMGVLKAEREAPGNIGKFEMLKSYLGKVETGKAAPTVQSLKAYAAYFAPELARGWTNDVPFAQAAIALTNEMALQLRSPSGGAGMPGAMSDSDREFLVKMTASLSNDPRAIPIMLDARIAMEKRSKDIGKIARDYRKTYGKIDDGFYAAIAAFAEREPLFANLPSMAPAGAAARTVIKYDKNGRRVQ